MSRPILLTAGGTGGHVFPAEALASELTRRGHSLAFVTDRRGAGFSGIVSYPISGGGIAGKSLMRRVLSLAGLARGYWQARALIKRLRPAAVIGFGGYASVPAVLAASHAGIPTALHEQNAVLGRANRLLAPKVSRIATCYDAVARIKDSWLPKVQMTGMPVRPAILALRDQPYPDLDGVLSLLVVGGSQGARIFSDVVPEALLRLPTELRQKLAVTQQCRPEDIERVGALYAEHGVVTTLRTFFDDMPARLAAAHLVIARCGASTMGELAAIGRPAILVPYLHAIDDHQSANAGAFAQAGGGWLMRQGDLTAESLSAQLIDLLGAPERLRQAAKAAHDCGVPDAAGRLADLVVELAGGRS
jgi:UDP-N-acetylglucosamine--N-acetylmuramyl-(pentapeptide) pyrophosphoryl-undecaprenol N-acetylglucosamine transferase